MNINAALSIDTAISWVNNQNFTDWRVVTLKYPYCGDLAVWRRALKHTFRELEQAFLRGSLLTTNKANGAGNSLRRLVVFGGDRGAGKGLHAHCLVDGIGNDEKFTALLRRAWHHSIARELRRIGTSKFIDQSADVYVKKSSDCCNGYVNYMLRYEGESLGFGFDKIVVEATNIS